MKIQNNYVTLQWGEVGMMQVCSEEITIAVCYAQVDDDLLWRIESYETIEELHNRVSQLEADSYFLVAQLHLSPTNLQNLYHD